MSGWSRHCIKVRLYLSHEEASLGVQQLALGSGVQQEGVAAEGEGPIQAKLMLRLVVCLPPCHIVVLNVQLLTARGRQGWLAGGGVVWRGVRLAQRRGTDEDDPWKRFGKGLGKRAGGKGAEAALRNV